jgi:hypothetical protein
MYEQPGRPFCGAAMLCVSYIQPLSDGCRHHKSAKVSYFTNEMRGGGPA